LLYPLFCDGYGASRSILVGPLFLVIPLFLISRVFEITHSSSVKWYFFPFPDNQAV